jgi:hypothetical protein
MANEKPPDERSKKGRKALRAKAIAIVNPDDGQICCVGGARLSEAMEDALEGREHVIMCRVNESTLEAVDVLVEAGLCDSRSTAAAFLIREGIKADADLFERIRDVTARITELKAELRKLVEPVMKDDAEETD